MTFAEIVAAAYEEALRDSPAPDYSFVLRRLSGGPYMSYRDQLDRPRRNYAGEVIPWIRLVRRNLRALGKPKQAPRLPQ